MVEYEFTSIRLRTSVKDKLDTIKVHPRETYEQVIERLIQKEQVGNLKGSK